MADGQQQLPFEVKVISGTLELSFIFYCFHFVCLRDRRGSDSLYCTAHSISGLHRNYLPAGFIGNNTSNFYLFLTPLREQVTTVRVSLSQSTVGTNATKKFTEAPLLFAPSIFKRFCVQKKKKKPIGQGLQGMDFVSYYLPQDQSVCTQGKGMPYWFLYCLARFLWAQAVNLDLFLETAF